mmetsp:Transcript_6668/g.12313  ORF Transcript_6668/g.12313 Transcript_6668/m.12313 type:complete len:297 (-) Transcript_6668:216-1106(-)
MVEIGGEAGAMSSKTGTDQGVEKKEVELASARGLLVLLRHGESMWNRKARDPNGLWRYAGSFDVALSESGIIEALEAGDRLRNIPLDVVFSSKLSRAMNTGMISLSKHSSGLTPVVMNHEGCYKTAMQFLEKLPKDAVMPVVCAAELNERCFGELQGMPSFEHEVKYTKEYLSQVRNDFTTKFPGEHGESTEDVFNRVVPYYEQNIQPLLEQGKNVLVCSHGFAIRALIKYLDSMSVKEFNVQMKKEKTDPENCTLLAATGVPLLYRYDHLSSSGLPEKVGAIDRDYELQHTCAPY